MSRPQRRWLLAGITAAVIAAGCGVFLLCGEGEQQAGSGGPGRSGPVAVVTAPAEATRITRTLETVGNVEASQSVVITAEQPGRVSAILFDEGRPVEQGAALVRLSAEQERADVAALRAEAAELRGRLKRLDGLAREGAVARGRVEDLRRQVAAADARIASARSQLSDTVIRAPFAGFVGLRELSLGALVQPGTELVTLDSTAEVDVRFNVSERDLGRVRVGSQVEVSSPAYPERRFSGAITSLDSRLDTAQRSLQAKARLPNGEGLLRPGMLGNVEIAVETIEGAITVPPMAVQVRGSTQFVYRIVEGCAQRVDVVTGQRQPERLEIVQGLSAGDTVAVEGLQFLSTATPVIDKKVQGQRGEQENEKGGAGNDPQAREADEGASDDKGERGGTRQGEGERKKQGGGETENGGEAGQQADAAARCKRVVDQAEAKAAGKTQGGG